MKIEVSKKSFFFLAGIAFLLLGGFFVYAYGTNNPSQFGHSIGEIDGFPTCSNGQALTKTASGWNCINVGSGGGSGSSGSWVNVNQQYLTECSGNPYQFFAYATGEGNHYGLSSCNQSSYFIGDESNSFLGERVFVALRIPSTCVGKEEYLLGIEHRTYYANQHYVREISPYQTYSNGLGFSRIRELSLAFGGSSQQGVKQNSNFTLFNWNTGTDKLKDYLYLEISGSNDYTIHSLKMFACR